MTFLETLGGGDPRSLHGVDEVLKAVRQKPGRFDELFACLFNEDEIVRMRAGDAIEKLAGDRPELLVPYRERLLNQVSEIKQPSVQWHFAEILAEIPLTPAQRQRGTRIMFRTVRTTDDWIVLNTTLTTLASFAVEDEAIRTELLPILRRRKRDSRKAVAKRAEKLLAQLKKSG